MDNNILEGLLKRKQELENKIIRAQAQKDTILAALKKEYNIEENQIEEKIKELEEEQTRIQKQFDELVVELKSYIGKMEEIISG